MFRRIVCKFYSLVLKANFPQKTFHIFNADFGPVIALGKGTLPFWARASPFWNGSLGAAPIFRQMLEINQLPKIKPTAQLLLK